MNSIKHPEDLVKVDLVKIYFFHSSCFILLILHLSELQNLPNLPNVEILGFSIFQSPFLSGNALLFLLFWQESFYTDNEEEDADTMNAVKNLLEVAKYVNFNIQYFKFSIQRFLFKFDISFSSIQCKQTIGEIINCIDFSLIVDLTCKVKC